MKDYKILIGVLMLLFVVQIGTAVTIKLIYGIAHKWLFVGGILSCVIAIYFMKKDEKPFV